MSLFVATIPKTNFIKLKTTLYFSDLIHCILENRVNSKSINNKNTQDALNKTHNNVNIYL